MSAHLARVNPGNQEIASATPTLALSPMKHGAPERYADWHWMAHQAQLYAEKKARLVGDREHRRMSDARRRAEKRAEGQVAAPVAEEILARQQQVAAEIRHRSNHGFTYEGGAVGGNPEYQIASIHYPGLVSSEHSILLAFVSRLPRRRNLLVGGTKAEAYAPAAKILGLDEPYVVVNSKVCSAVRIELDTDLSEAVIRAHCRDCAAPLPNIVVGHRDHRGLLRRPHLIWLLHEGAPLESEATRFASLFRGVSRGLTGAFLELGADPGGLSNAHRVKNPLSPLWSRLVLAEQPYDLSALTSMVDIRTSVASLEKRAFELRQGTAPEQDHPDADVALGSNAYFRALTRWARKKVVAAKTEGISEAEFAILVAEEAHRLAALLLGGDSRRSEPRAKALAKLVTNWTWNVFRPRTKAQRKAALMGESLKLALQEGGRRACEKRAAESFALVGWAMATLSANGEKLRQIAVLELVIPHGVTSARTVGRHWHAVLDAVAAGRRFPGPSAAEQAVPVPSEQPPTPLLAPPNRKPKTAPPSARHWITGPAPEPASVQQSNNNQEVQMPENTVQTERPAVARMPVPACLRPSAPAAVPATRKKKSAIPLKQDPAPTAAIVVATIPAPEPAVSMVAAPAEKPTPSPRRFVMPTVPRSGTR